MQDIIVWPDGSWCYPEELHEMQHRGDDYIKIILTGESYEDGDINYDYYITEAKKLVIE